MRLRGLVVMGFVVALAAGCSGSSGGGGAPTATPPAATSSTAVASASAERVANGATDAGVDPGNPGAPIASVNATVGMNNDPKAKLKVDVLSLKRRNKLLVLTLQVTPTNTLSGSQALFTLLGNSFWEPSLIDSVNLKEYTTVNGDGLLRSSVTSVRAGSGQPMYLYAVFAAPPPGVTTLDVLFASSVPALNDVPIS